jgi:TetR/AcrR family transcriptional regulator, regulator of autoinduction and epiphytic fitness
MDQPVKTPRPYHSPKHAAMRRATRQSVIAAAGRLFSERGYAGSSIEAIAGAAGVAVPTVYAAFGNKRSILLAMLAASVDEADVDEAEPKSRFDDATALLDEITDGVAERLREQAAGVSDPATRVRKIMRLNVSILAQTAVVRRVIRGAAAMEPEIQSLLDEIYHHVYVSCQTAACLAIGATSNDARTRRLTDVIFAFTSSDLFDLLTGQRGWSVAEYEHWAIQTVTAALPA